MSKYTSIRVGDLAADGKTYRHMISLRKLLLELHARKAPAPKGMPRLQSRPSHPQPFSANWGVEIRARF